MIPNELLTCITCYLNLAVTGYALCETCLNRVRPQVEVGDIELAVEEASRIIAEGRNA